MTSYQYDDIYQLTHVDYPSGSDYGYQYDAVGNRTKMFEYTTSTITTNYVYDNADELTQWTTSTVTMTFTYASDGCLSTKSDGTDTWTYDWDYERRLKAFKKNGATLVEYAHNPTGTRRYSSDSTLGLTNYFHSNGHVLGDYSSNWSLNKSYILGANAMVDRTTDPNASYYLTKDRLGSTREIVNSAENDVTCYDYDVWSDATESHLIGSVSTRYRAGGLESLADGLYAKSRRMYDPSLGRDVQANFDRTMLFRDGGRYDGPGAQLSQAHEKPCCGGPNGIPFSPCSEEEEGYCEMWLEDCHVLCDLDQCKDKYHRALCYRCCQCYYKRCWGDGCGDKWEKMDDPKPRVLLGPPDRCNSAVSCLVCYPACHGVDYNLAPGRNEPCDDEGHPHTWQNICSSSIDQGTSQVFQEYGDSVPLEAQFLAPFGLGECRGCAYKNLHFGRKTIPGLTYIVYINTSEKCPDYMPKHIGGYGVNRYWGDWHYLNSCRYLPK